MQLPWNVLTLDLRMSHVQLVHTDEDTPSVNAKCHMERGTQLSF